MGIRLLSVALLTLALAACGSIEKKKEDEEFKARMGQMMKEAIADNKELGDMYDGIIPVPGVGFSATNDRDYGRTPERPIATGGPQGTRALLEILLRDDDGYPFRVLKVPGTPGDYILEARRSGAKTTLYVDPSAPLGKDGKFKPPFGVGYVKDVKTASKLNAALQLFQKGGDDAATEKAFLALEKDTYYADYHLALLALKHKDPRSAYYFYLNAGNTGHSTSYGNAAVMLYEGEGVAKDTKTAVQMIKKSADADLIPEMQLKLSTWYFEEAPEQERDKKKALFYAEKSAYQGIRPAIIYYAALLITDERIVEALSWSMLYYNTGNGDRDRGADLESRLSGRMTPEEYVQAKEEYGRLRQVITIDKRYLD